MVGPLPEAEEKLARKLWRVFLDQQRVGGPGDPRSPGALRSSKGPEYKRRLQRSRVCLGDEVLPPILRERLGACSDDSDCQYLPVVRAGILRHIYHRAVEHRRVREKAARFSPGFLDDGAASRSGRD